eukprot:8191611-Alexandrium_andersonii.AAC.1
MSLQCANGPTEKTSGALASSSAPCSICKCSSAQRDRSRSKVGAPINDCCPWRPRPLPRENPPPPPPPPS